MPENTLPENMATNGTEPKSAPPNSAAQKAQEAAQKAKDAVDQFSKAQKTLQSQSGMKRLVVHGAQIICDSTIPPGTCNILNVFGPRPMVDGRQQANVTDVEAGKNINPWPCQCQKQPMGNNFKPCSYQVNGNWFPGVRTQPVDSKVSSAGGNVPNMGRAMNIAQELMKKGWGLNQAAGIMGNIMVESQWLTMFMETSGGGGLGWIQWTGPRATNFLNWSKAQGLNPTSDAANMGFLSYESSSGAGWVTGSTKGFNTMKSPEDAAKYWMRNYEKPYEPTSHLNQRMETARKIADQLKTYAICETDHLKCTFGGIISIADPGQVRKCADPNGFAGVSNVLGGA